MSDTSQLPTEAWLCALSELEGMGPARLAHLLGRYGPQDAWQAVLDDAVLCPETDKMAGVGPKLVSDWRSQARQVDVAALWGTYVAAGVGVVMHESPGYPDQLLDDIEAPAVLFVKGELSALQLPRVAIVGTRRCSRYGSDIAFELGRDLSAAGVCVVSGLALGIDGAAHAGALDAQLAPPVAVVGCGLNRIYPRRNRELWQAVAKAGAVISEAPLGARPERWRFPARNRIIAGLADVVIVVESATSGGSMHTVGEAQDRDIPVMAVPGPVRSAASAGTNDLLADGALMVRSAEDVLTLLGLSAEATMRKERRPKPDETGLAVLDAFCWQPADLEVLVTRTGLGLGEVAVQLESLISAGWIARRGAWYERVGA